MPNNAKTSGKRRAYILLAIGLIAVAPYLANLTDGFISDDWVHLAQGQTASLGRIIGGDALAVGYYRPLPLALTWVETRLFGLRPAGYHAVNIVLALLATLAVLALLTRLLPPRTAIWAGLAFAVSAAHVENTVWISGRSEILATIFLMWGLIAHVQWRAGGRRLFLLLSLPAYFLALACNEIALTFPLLVLAIDRRLPSKPTWKASVTAALIAATSLFAWLAAKGFAMLGHHGGPIIPHAFGLHCLRDLVRFAQLFFVPLGFTEAIPAIVKYKYFAVAALLAVGGALAYGGRNLWRRPGVRLGLIGGLLCLLPAAHLYPRRMHLYLAGVWFAIAIADAVAAAWESGREGCKRAATIAFAGWLLLNVAAAFSLAQTWHRASRLAAVMVDDLTAVSLPQGKMAHLLVLTAPDSLREAFVMRNGLHQAMRLRRPDAQVIVHPMTLVSMKEKSAAGLNVMPAYPPRIYVEFKGSSQYDCLLPPDANHGLKPQDMYPFDLATYRPLKKDRPFCLTAMEMIVDPTILWGEHTVVLTYNDGRLVPYHIGRKQ